MESFRLEERKLNNIPPKEVNRIPSRVNVNISDDIDELTEIYKKLSFKMKQRMETKPKLSSAKISFIDESVSKLLLFPKVSVLHSHCVKSFHIVIKLRIKYGSVKKSC